MSNADNPKPAPPPEVRPVSELEWIPKDARWLTGGRRLHAVLAIVLLLLIALPVMIGGPEHPMDEGPPGNTAGDGVRTREAPGVYWRWSEPTGPTLFPGIINANDRLRYAVTRWLAALLPAIAAILVLISLRLRGTGRMLLLASAGLLLAEEVWRYLPGLIRIVFDHDMLPNAFRQSGRAPFREKVYLGEGSLQFPLLLLLGVLHGGSRCQHGSAPRLAVLILTLPLVLVAGFFIAGVCVDPSLTGFFIPSRFYVSHDPMDLSTLMPCDWVAMGFVILARVAALALAVFGVFVAAGGDRRVMRAGFLTVVVLFGCGIAVQMAQGIQVGYFYWTKSAGRWDYFLRGGVLVHRLLPQAIGFVLIAAGLGRLTTAVCVGRALRGGTPDLSSPPTSSAPDDCEQNP